MKTLLYIFIWIPFVGFCQNFNFKNELSGVLDTWHTIELNNEILKEINDDFSDIRIYAIDSKNDTIEIPYFLQKQSTLVEKIGINFKIINKSTLGNEKFFTFKLQDVKEINEILLDFRQDNFNWKIDLQASNDQKKWFDILKQYRILSIKNEITDYQFSRLIFPDSEYKYYRIRFKTDAVASLKSATLQKTFDQKIDFENIAQDFSVENDQKKKISILDVDLEENQPISQITLDFSDEVDFQRPIRIEYLVDSFKTEKGWRYSYNTLVNSYVSSLSDNKFFVNAVFTNKLKISIWNYDNQALNIQDVKLKRLKYNLTTRLLSKDNQYFITYGNSNSHRPNYDIASFEENIPKKLKPLKIGEQISLKKEVIIEESIVTKWWLWAMIGLIILLLGYSTLSMLKKAEK